MTTRLTLAVVLTLTFLTGSASAQSTPANVVGSWRYGTINPVTYWDKQTGAYQGHGGGMSRTYQFDDAGNYKMFQLIQTNNYGWQMSVFTFEAGKATWDAKTVTLAPTAGKFKCVDNRVQRNNYERPMTDDELRKHTKTEPYRLERRDGKQVFVTGTAGKDEIPFRREETTEKK